MPSSFSFLISSISWLIWIPYGLPWLSVMHFSMSLFQEWDSWRWLDREVVCLLHREIMLDRREFDRSTALLGWNYFRHAHLLRCPHHRGGTASYARPAPEPTRFASQLPCGESWKDSHARLQQLEAQWGKTSLDQQFDVESVPPF